MELKEIVKKKYGCKGKLESFSDTIEAWHVLHNLFILICYVFLVLFSSYSPVSDLKYTNCHSALK